MDGCNYDLIIIGGGAAGLFTSIHAPDNLKKIILEKNDCLGQKILLSGGNRCNITNQNLDIENHYFSENIPYLHKIFHQFNNIDMMNWLQNNKIKYQEEFDGKIYLAPGYPSIFLNKLIQLAKANFTDIITNIQIIKIILENNSWQIITNQNKFNANKLIIATGGKSYPQIGSSGFGFQIAQQHGLGIIPIFPGLCGLEMREDVSKLTGITILARLELIIQNKHIYQENNSLLFTHWGVSGPGIFNLSLALGYYLRKINYYEDLTQIINKDIKIKITFEYEKINKKIIHHFNLQNQENIVYLNISQFRNWTEAKVTGGGIKLPLLTPFFESKKISNLYFIGEILDVTGKTGGYNLQFARSSGYVCGKNL